MRDKGIAHIGIGVGSGEDKAVDAIKSAMESPLLETTVSGATDIIINFSGDIGIQEVYEAVSYLTEVAGDEANIIFGNVESEDVPDDEVSITIIATGLHDVSGKGASAVRVKKGMDLLIADRQLSQRRVAELQRIMRQHELMITETWRLRFRNSYRKEDNT